MYSYRNREIVSFSRRHPLLGACLLSLSVVGSLSFGSVPSAVHFQLNAADLRRIDPISISLRSAERVTLSLNAKAEVDYSSLFAAVETARPEREGELEGLARRGLEDTKPILRDPKLTIRSRSISALSQTTAATRPTSPTSISGVSINPIWVSIGPEPIPNGQTDPEDPNTGISFTQNPVSGRTTAVAIHPTNPNIAYVGAAQGGLYRTLDGGATWTQLLDNAGTNAVGVVRIDPLDSTKVIVGTGEGNFSGDSFVGTGVYLITNADGTSPVLNGPFNSDGANHDLFTNRCVIGMAIDSQNDNNVFVGSVTGVVGLYGVLPSPLPRRGLFRSTNFMSGSPTWQKLSVLGEDVTTSASDYRVTAVVVEPGNANNVTCAIADPSGGTNAGIYRSTNGLAANPTFTKVFDLSDSTNASFAPVRMAIQKNSSNGQVTVVACAGYLNDTSTTTFNQGRVYKSTDAGATWTELTGARGFAGGQGFYNLGIDIDPVNPNNIYVVGTLSAQTQAGQVDTGDNGTFIFTHDGGTTWGANPFGLHVDSHMVGVAPSNPQVIYTGNDGGVWRSDDAGQHWTDINTATYSATQFQSIAVHPNDRNFSLGGTQDNGTPNLLPATNWHRADFGDGGFALIDQSAANTQNVTMYHTYFNAKTVLEGFGRVRSSSCATESQWAFRGAAVGVLPGGDLPIVLPVVNSTVCDGSPGQNSNGLSLTDDVNFYAPMALGPPVTGSQGDTLYYGADRLYRSIDQGDNMVAVSGVLEPAGAPINPGDIKPPGTPAVPPSNTPISAIAISPQDDNVRVVGTNTGNLYATTVGGALVVVTQTGMPAKPVARIKIDPNNKAVAYASFVGSGFSGTNHVWKTTNLGVTGATWTATGNGLPDASVNAIAIDPQNSNHVYVGTDHGVYNSTDAGATWNPYGIGLPPVAVFDLAIQDSFRILRAATHGRGYYEIPTVQHMNVLGAVSSKMHGALGPFGVPLPFSGTTDIRSGIECRTGGANGDHQVVISFQNSVSSVGSVSVTSIDNMATADTPIVSGQTVTINLHHVANAQVLTINLVNVNDSTTTGNVSVEMGVLLGDVDATGRVDGNDVSAVQSHTRQVPDTTNYRYDVDASGRIDGNDVSTTQTQTRTGLPPSF
jgi:photosystem II stability/assembly factor-like uncharacterized protein